MAAPATRARARRGLSHCTFAPGPEASRGQNGQTMLQVTSSFSVPPEKAELGLGSKHHLLYGAPRESGAEKEKNSMYQNRVSIIGFRRERRTT